MKHEDSKERIFRAGLELIPLLGYNATGLEAILQKAGVPKGSFYHFFRSKEQFCLELLRRYVQERDALLNSFLEDTEKAPLDRLRAYVDHVIARMEEQECRRGCLVGNLSQELSDQSETFRSELVLVSEKWQEKVAACLREAQERGELHADTDCMATARFFFSALEGAVLQAKLFRSVAPLRDLNNICARVFLITGDQEKLKRSTGD